MDSSTWQRPVDAFPHAAPLAAPYAAASAARTTAPTCAQVQGTGVPAARLRTAPFGLPQAGQKSTGLALLAALGSPPPRGAPV